MDGIGIVPNLPFEEYVERPGVNGSLLKVVDEFSMRRAKAVIDGKLTVESDAMDFGTCFHSLLLEGRIDYAVHPETYPSSEGEKPWRWNANFCKEWEKEQEGKKILSKAEAEQIEAMVAAVHDVAELRPFLAGQREVSVFAEKDGYPVKSRIDLLPKEGPVIDFKKARNPHPEAFLRQAIEKRYHLAAAWNLDCLRWAGDTRTEFWLVAVEATPPFDVSILKFQDMAGTFLRVGRVKARAAFQKLKNAYAEDRWPSYGIHFAEDHAKPWQMQELETTA
jgi:hypothetical protein